MPDTRVIEGDRLKSTQPKKHSHTGKPKWRYGYGHYRYCIPTQDQAIIDFQKGRISGILKPSLKDSQSEDLGIPPASWGYEEILLSQLWKSFEEKINIPWKSEYSSDAEEPIQCVAVLEQADEQETDAPAADVSQLTSDQLVSAILHPEAESDIPLLREMIFIAEDANFTIEESKQLSPWLLNFAERHRDSSDPQNEPTVWSAIRTGASMLRPHAADCLRPLLEPGHSIETSLVTVKMLGRIFEAQPPA
ncbi:MAG: hypothetical protein KAV87_22770, partial [Desulfobacteraceae bacterium]|nr:hypothetical protein [Desulfobacteraceae bacterium]